MKKIEQTYKKLESNDYDMRGWYTKECSTPTCDKLHTVFTQEDDYPEYYTTVSVKCACGELVKFELPVN